MVLDIEPQESLEMWCWEKKLRISWSKFKTNTSILEQIDTPQIDFVIHVPLTTKLNGHVSRREDDTLEKN